MTLPMLSSLAVDTCGEVRDWGIQKAKNMKDNFFGDRKKIISTTISVAFIISQIALLDSARRNAGHSWSETLSVLGKDVPLLIYKDVLRSVQGVQKLVFERIPCKLYETFVKGLSPAYSEVICKAFPDRFRFVFGK